MDKNLKRIQEDVDAMNKAFGNTDGIGGTTAPKTESASTEAPGTKAATTEPAATDAPKTESPGTEAPKTDAPRTEAPGTAAPKTEAPTTEAPEEEGERLKRENEALRKRVDELSGTGKPPKTSAPKTSAPATDAPVEVIDFLKDLDIDELTRNPEEFNRLLNVVVSKGLDKSEKVIVEKVLRSLPDIVKTNILTINDLRKASEQFYKDNEDLVPFKKVVAATFEEVASENPDKKYDDLFKDVAVKAREKLELVRKATDKDKDRHPTLPHRRSQQRQTAKKPETTPLESELDAMDDALNLT